MSLASSPRSRRGKHFKERLMMWKNAGGRVSMAAVWCAAICLSLAGISASGQVNTGTLSGQIVDPSGAVVGNANLTIRDDATGYERVTKTAADGNYIFPD